jgi:hypothetical protein
MARNGPVNGQMNNGRILNATWGSAYDEQETLRKKAAFN